MPAALPSPVPSDADLWPGELPFTAFGQWGEDRLDLRVFDQDVWWVDRFGEPHLLDRMPPDYVRNVIGHLETYLPYFYASCSLKEMIELCGELVYGLPGSAAVARDAGVPAVAETDPAAWLDATPLMRQLRRLDYA